MRIAMILLIPFLFLLSACDAETKTVRIMVIDSGLDMSNPGVKVCPNQSVDLTNTLLMDDMGHGTNITHIIADPLGDQDYCIIIVKVFASWEFYSLPETRDTSEALSLALRYALLIKPDIINLSAGGHGFDWLESVRVKNVLDQGIKFFAAAGNAEDKKSPLNLDENCDFFPACYDSRVMVVGNLGFDDKPHYTSNYGNYVKEWEHGVAITAGGYTMTGTSQATAIATANAAKILIESRKVKQLKIKQFANDPKKEH